MRQYGYESYYLIYLISRWMLLVYIATTRVVRVCRRTQCSMTSRSISRSNITILGIWCREDQWSSSMLQRMSKKLICWTSHWLEWDLSILGRSLVFSRSRFLPRESDEFVSPSDMVRGLVPSMVRYKWCALLKWWKAELHMVRCKWRDALMWLWVVLTHDWCREILMWLWAVLPHD